MEIRHICIQHTDKVQSLLAISAFTPATLRNISPIDLILLATPKTNELENNLDSANHSPEEIIYMLKQLMLEVKCNQFWHTLDKISELCKILEIPIDRLKELKAEKKIQLFNFITDPKKVYEIKTGL